MTTDIGNVVEPNGQMISRRTVVAGAAWAAPALIIASAAPAMAASVPPCTPSGDTVGNTTVWDVGASYPGCSNNSHPDYLLMFQMNPGACPTCTVGGVSRPITTFRITVTLNHSWAYWEAWTGGEALTRTYYLRNTAANNCVDPGIDCTVASYTTAGLTSNGTWANGNAKCNNSYIAVPNSGDSFYDCHAVNAVDDGIHVNPCWWDTHTYVEIPFTYQAGWESTVGSSPVSAPTFSACSDFGQQSGTIRISKPAILP